MSQSTGGPRPFGHTCIMHDSDDMELFDESRLTKWRCPGVFREIEFLACPECGAEIEFFPQDLVMACPGCGAEATRASSACISHCPAKESYCYRQMVRNQALAARKGSGAG